MKVDFGAICSGDMQRIRYSRIQVGRQLGKNVLVPKYIRWSFIITSFFTSQKKKLFLQKKKKVIVTIRNSMFNLFSLVFLWREKTMCSIFVLVGWWVFSFSFFDWIFGWWMKKFRSNHSERRTNFSPKLWVIAPPKGKFSFLWFFKSTKVGKAWLQFCFVPKWLEWHLAVNLILIMIVMRWDGS